MKKIILFTIIFITSISCIWANDAEILYVEGDTTVKDSYGDRWEPYIGDFIEFGDTIYTGEDGYAEIDRENSIIKLSPSTVFTLQQAGAGDKKQNVYSCTLGSMYLDMQKYTGYQPRITTACSVAGVRGTIFSVYSGMDGSSLIAVEQGMVEVQAAGQTVEITKDEGVEVEPGEPPGEKFEVLHGKVDYSKWNKGKEEEFLANPVGTAEGIQKTLSNYINELNNILPVYDQHKKELAAEREKLEQIEEKEGKDARKKYYEEVVFPLELVTSGLRLNIRYYALSALSLRRYVLGRLYMIMKTKYINDLNNDKFTGFTQIYQAILKNFEKSIVPYLVQADI